MLYLIFRVLENKGIKRKIDTDLTKKKKNKRIRTPSPIRKRYEAAVEQALLEKSRTVYASKEPSEFLPKHVFSLFPFLSNDYQYVDPDNFYLNMNEETKETALKKLKELILHSFVVSDKFNCYLITQVEFYYKDQEVDDVVMIDEAQDYINCLKMNIEKFQEGKGTWYELRFTYNKSEIVVTGALHGNLRNSDINAFLGVSAPLSNRNDYNFLLFSPKAAGPTIAVARMLRNYKKEASMFPWCIKSVEFRNIGFSTPMPLELHEN